MPRFLRKDGAASEGNTLERRRPLSFLRPALSRHKEPARTRGEGGRSSGGSTMGDEQLSPEYRHSSDLRKMLEDEAASCRRRIETYKQAQQHQAALVSKLQAKLLQYKQRCKELEGRMEEVLEPDRRGLSALEAAQAQLREAKEERIQDIDTAHRLLTEERRKNEKLIQVNNALRAQLEDAHESNEALTNDLQKLSTDWAEMRDEMQLKENEWKEEEQYYNDYFSQEQARLMEIWRDVVNMKRYFTEFKNSTTHDLSKMKSDLSTASREIVNQSTGIQAKHALSASLQEESKLSVDQEMNALKGTLAQLKAENESQSYQMKAKEEKLQSLMRELRSLEDRCGRAEESIGEMGKLQSELELLQNALRDVAHAVLHDAETRDNHIHLTPQAPIPPKSPKRTRSQPTSAAFVESTISAVQASLHKYQLHIHDLQVKLENSRETLVVTKKQLEVLEETNKAMDIRIAELTAQLDACKALSHQLGQEKENLLKSLESSRAEKTALEKNRTEMNDMLDRANIELEKAQKMIYKLQKEIDTLEDEKLYLKDEIERLSKDSDLRELNLRAEEDRCSRLKEENLTLREELAKAQLAKDLLEQQKAETDSLLSHIDKSRGEVESELEQVLMEKSDMHEALNKAEAQVAHLEEEKKRLIDDIKKLEEEKSNLQNQSQDQDSDLASLRKEILHGEQIRLDLDSERVSLQEKCKFLEMEKEKVELELAQVSRERSELSNQLSVAGRKREALAEEVSRIKQRLEQANETNSRINRSLEDLVKDCENKQVMLEGNEKEIQRLQEVLASMRVDKEALEATLFDVQANLEEVNSKRNQLEKDLQESLVQQEALKGEISLLKTELENAERKSQEMKTTLTQQAGAKEGEYQQIISNLKKKNEETINKLTEEKEQVRAMLENKLQTSMAALTGEKDGEIKQLQDRIAALQQQIENVVQQHEEVLLRAESDKQQALLLAQQDQQALAEKLDDARREIETERSAHERNRRDAAARTDQDRAVILSLKESLASAAAKYEQLRLKAEEDKAALENRISELIKERDNETQCCEDLKLQLHLSEDKVDSLQAQYNDTARRLKDVESSRENLLKELTDVKRLLADSTFEKEKYSGSNKELREHIKRVEGQKREQSRTLEEAMQRIAGLEEAKRNLELERSRLQGMMREIDRNLMEMKQESGGLDKELEKAKGELEGKKAEIRQLEARVTSVTEERDRALHQQHHLSKQIQEVENALDNMREEVAKVRSKGEEDERRWREREEELLLRLEDSRTAERKIQDAAHNLEVCLADATQQIQELKARLGGSEGRVHALEAQLIQVETAKREVEGKLSSIGSTLRRIAGIQMDGSVSLPYKLSSPTRRWSPVRGEERGDVDPEAVRRGIRTLMQGIAQVERERDDLRSSLSESKKQTKSQADELTKCESKLSSTVNALRQVQEEKGSLEARLGQKTAALQAQMEANQKSSDEIHQLQEKLTILEIALKTANEEKAQLEEKLEKLKQSLSFSEIEKKSLQEELAKTESRATKLELQRLGMEGDIQRLQIMLQEKDSTIQKLQERLEIEVSHVSELEERCASLKATVEQLTNTLEKASESEKELHQEIESLQRTLVESSATSQANADRLKSLQKALYSAENEKRIIAERLESAQNSLADSRRSLQILKETQARLQSDLAASEVERSALESQVRLSQWPNDEKEESRRQISELTSKLDTLQDRVRHLENEKRSLERKLHSTRSKSFERGEKISSSRDQWGEGSLLGSVQHLLEQENHELKAKIKRLETELAEKENELQRLKSLEYERPTKDWSSETDRYRTAKVQAERLLEAREQSHRQQVLRLESQIRFLKEQLSEEVKRRQQFVLRSSRAGREVQQLHRVLGSSLRNVSQDPSVDSYLLEKEARKLDTSISPLALPPPHRK